MASSIEQLSQHLTQAVAQAGERDTLAYAWPSSWNEGQSLQVDGRTVPVRYCTSPLQLREALIEPTDQPRVLLVGCEEADLGQDVLARLFRHRLLHVDRWQMVMEAFGAVQVDPRLYAIPWMPDALLEAAPKRPGQALTALTYDHALEICLAHVFGLEDHGIDLEVLLTAVETGSRRWGGLPEPQREVCEHYLAAKLGAVASAVLGAANAGNGHAVMSVGLVCEVLFGPASAETSELRDARVRLESRLGGTRLAEADGRRWAETAIRLLPQRDEVQQHTAFRTAVDLLKDLGAEDFVAESSVLPVALDQRLEELADAVGKFLRKSSALVGVERAAERVAAHDGVRPGNAAFESAEMVVRLCRREALAASTGTSQAGASEYLADGAWEDWARRALRGVQPDALARAAEKLLDRVAKRRLESDRRFAEDLARHARQGTHPKQTLPVEQALAELAAPVATDRPLLIVVLDGMSWDVYLSIALELKRSGWTAWRRENAPSSLLATVPSVTECSRASLLAGRLMRGTSAQEKTAFAAQEALKRVSKSKRPPVLLHKAGIEEGGQLSKEATALLADPEQRVVGIVINAIDDALAKSEQVRIDWSAKTIPLLGAAIAQARAAGRAVFITSDHGHVIERGAEYRNVSDTERWRPANGEPQADEIMIDGPRVKALMGKAVIVPWAENVRYATKKNGYHGGATQQEMLVPVGIWTSDSDAPPGCVPEFIVPPDWWTGEGRESSVPAAKRPGRTGQSVGGSPKAGATEDLFAPPKQKSTWISELLISDALGRQRGRVGRTALDDDRLERLLQCLDEHGGRASVEQLAAALRQPQLRLRGVLSVFQRMMNIDGYPIVKVESATQTVFLDIRLLRTQFEL